MASMTLGRNDASWIAAATLDRYLRSTSRPQIFGTQFTGPPEGPIRQGDYDSVLLPDSLRQVLRVPVREQQQQRLKQMNAQK